MDDRERAIRTRLKNDFVHYASKCLKIRTKRGDVLPFTLNKGQLYAHQLVEDQKMRTGKVRAIVLKSRQIGMSTYIGGRLYHKVTHRSGVRAFILTHEAEATSNLFEMSQRFYDNCPAIVRPEATASSSKELYFGALDSGYKVGTAGNKAVGRSSTIQYLHASETAFWPNAIEHSQGILQAVPNEPDTEVFMESTANGIGNYFHEQWQLAESGESDFIPVFIPWFWQDEYRRELNDGFAPSAEEADLIKLYGLNAHQLMWRRYKIIELSAGGIDGAKAFAREYPSNAAEAFQTSGEDTFIPPELVMRARKTKCEAVGPLVVGVDPARFGNDRTAIVYRRGRVAYNLKTYQKKDTMEIAGIVHTIIKNDNPDKVFIDIGGLGAGVYDRLVELGLKNVVVAVNAGSSPLNPELYRYKRDELWGEGKKWLENAPIQIPDSDELHADLVAPKYKFDSLTRVNIEPKADMKKRGIRSSDCADALFLTFAEPVGYIQQSKNQAESVADQIMSSQNKLHRLRTSYL